MKDKKGLDKKTIKIVLGTAASVSLISIGYAIGFKRHAALMSRGIERCWDRDPSLKDHMWNVAIDIAKNP